MQWDGTVCTGKTGQVAKVNLPLLISNSSNYTCLQSHLESPEKPLFPSLLAHSSACLLAQQLDLLPSLNLTLCPHLLLVNPISPPISYAPNCLKSLPPKEPHVPSPWLGTDAERSSLSTTAIKPSQNWLIALKRRMGEHLSPAWAILTTRGFFLPNPPELLPLKNPSGEEGGRWLRGSYSRYRGRRTSLCPHLQSYSGNALLNELSLPPRDAKCFRMLSLWVFVCCAK